VPSDALKKSPLAVSPIPIFLAKHNMRFAIGALLENLRKSQNYRQAEYNFELSESHK
jgi:hypothetical protein